MTEGEGGNKVLGSWVAPPQTRYGPLVTLAPTVRLDDGEVTVLCHVLLFRAVVPALKKKKKHTQKLSDAVYISSENPSHRWKLIFNNDISM